VLITKKIIGTIGCSFGQMSLPSPFVRSWGRMCAFTESALCREDEYVNIADSTYNYHDVFRNDLLNNFLGDWMLMFDTDVTFDPDIAARMVVTMERAGVDVLTGIYSYKKPPHNPVLYMWNPEFKRHEVITDWDRSSDLFPVDSAGAGCLLVKRSVFERITSELNENPFDRYGAKGEDHSFFMRLDKLGIKAYCAWKIELQHLEYLGVAPSTHFKLPDSVPNQTKWDVVGKRVAVPALAGK
jgi:hypothetical protein